MNRLTHIAVFAVLSSLDPRRLNWDFNSYQVSFGQQFIIGIKKPTFSLSVLCLHSCQVIIGGPSICHSYLCFRCFICFYLLQIAIVIEWAIVSFIASSFSKIPANLLAVFFAFETLGLCIGQGDVLLEYCLGDRITKFIFFNQYLKGFRLHDKESF